MEQGYKQAKGELGWADFQGRADAAIQRHWHLVCCAFTFCWWAWFHAEAREDGVPTGGDAALAPATSAAAVPVAAGRGGGKRSAAPAGGNRERADPVAWPVTVRQVRGWLTPWHLLRRC